MNWTDYDKPQHPRGLVKESMDLVDAEEQERLLLSKERIKFIDMPSQFTLIKDDGGRNGEIYRVPDPLIRLIAEVVNSDDFMKLLRHRAKAKLRLARELLTSRLRVHNIVPSPRQPFEGVSKDPMG